MTVVLEHDGPVAVVTLDRPERRNAVDHPTLLELLDVQSSIADDAPAAVRAVVLTGRPPAFSAGADLTGVEEGRFATDLSAVLRGFGALPVPVIAAIDGAALGAGAQLAVAVDLRVATPGSRFGIPAARLGLVVDHWTIRRLTSELTPAVARSMLLAAETYTAEQLHRSGGVHRLGGLDAAVEWAHELAGLAPLTIAAHKLGLERSTAEPVADDLFEAARAAAWASADAEEGRTAFLAKRPPEFTGR
jgi:enoyl-CoA hydratase